MSVLGRVLHLASLLQTLASAYAFPALNAHALVW